MGYGLRSVNAFADRIDVVRIDGGDAAAIFVAAGARIFRIKDEKKSQCFNPLCRVIGGRDRRKPPLDALLGHKALPYARRE